MNELEKLKFSKFCTADLSSRDNNNNEWKNKFTRERNHFCNTNIETFSCASFELVSNLKLSNSKLQSIEFLAKN